MCTFAAAEDLIKINIEHQVEMSHWNIINPLRSHKPRGSHAR